MELPAKQVCIQNEQILKELYKTLSEKVTSDQVKSKILLFLGNVKKLVAQIEKAIPPSTVVHYNTAPKNTIDKIFQYNTELLLNLVPVQQKTSAMKRLPLYFSDSIKKIVQYLQGDKSWLLPSRINSAEKKVGKSIDTMELSIEGHSHTNTVPSEIQTGHPESKRIASLEEDDLGYPPIYHALSRQTELNHILDPLFELLFPQNTHLLSRKHCKKTH